MVFKQNTSKFVWLIFRWPLPELHRPCRETTQRNFQGLLVHGWNTSLSIYSRG